MAANVLIQQTQVKSVRAEPTQVEWSTGILDCCDDMSICCFGYWCYPCFACKTASDFGECICLPLLDVLWTIPLFFGVPICVPPVAFAMRVGVRNRYGIKGDMCTDCIMVGCCNACAWCQIAREIRMHRQPVTYIEAQSTVFAIAVQP